MRLVPGKPVCYITVVRQSSEGVVNKANSNKSGDCDANQLSNHWRSRSDAEQKLFFTLTLQSAMQQYYRSDTAHPWKTSCKSRKRCPGPWQGHHSGWTIAVADDNQQKYLRSDCFLFSFLLSDTSLSLNYNCNFIVRGCDNQPSTWVALKNGGKTNFVIKSAAFSHSRGNRQTSCAEILHR